jgi:endoglucanase
MNLDIPETGGPIPDMLAEVRYNLEWMLSMQDDADGGVWHKATSAEFCGFVSPEDDHLPILIVGSGESPFKTTASTADLASVSAIAARVYAPFDGEFAKRCLDAATAAWGWLETNPSGYPFAQNPEGIHTGQYEDLDVRDEPLWAAAELYRTTGEARFNDYFLKHYTQWDELISPDIVETWADVRNMAMYAYALCGREDADSVAVAHIREAAVAAADVLVARATGNGYRTPMRPKDYVWGSNSVVGNYALMLLMANRLAPNPVHFAVAQDCLHYLLGRNTFNISFVTQVGSNWAMSPHHRPSIADAIEHPWPGLLMGGPRATEPTPPARQWVDYWGDASRNENAINWNAPLVFMLAEALPEPDA